MASGFAIDSEKFDTLCKETSKLYFDESQVTSLNDSLKNYVLITFV
jgi:hypothetical protein